MASKYTSDIYLDTGCGGRCLRSLECPYQVCIEDSPIRSSKSRRLHEAILEGYAAGMTVDQLAEHNQINVRTVFRALARERAVISTSRGSANATKEV